MIAKVFSGRTIIFDYDQGARYAALTFRGSTTGKELKSAGVKILEILRTNKILYWCLDLEKLSISQQDFYQTMEAIVPLIRKKSFENPRITIISPKNFYVELMLNEIIEKYQPGYPYLAVYDEGNYSESHRLNEPSYRALR